MICPLCQHNPCLSFAQVDGLDYFRCQRCQLTFLDPAQLPEAEAERRHYDLHENHPTDPRYRDWLDRLAIPLGERLVGSSEGLDFGCGPGPALAQMLSERGHAMSLYDPVYAADVSVLQRDYDFVTCTEVVEHFHHPGREFERLATLLRPGGWLAIMTSLLHDGIDFRKWHYRRDPTHVSFYRQATFSWIANHYRMQLPDMISDSVIFLRK
ncbi:MAG: class I SAM-dependent methyltransferase [Alcanivoracaceae bacterium]|jgi:SAM-dependent methyltransferase|nr:class I SAM-dependent methyltransferase [Alcanivoracaceae bacterium]